MAEARGDSDSKMTIDVHAKLEQVRQARSRSALRSACMPTAEWRDPESNRGHHDFQGRANLAETLQKSCKSDARRSGVLDVDTRGFP
jgi:hypothetical protein